MTFQVFLAEKEEQGLTFLYFIVKHRTIKITVNSSGVLASY